MFLPNFYEDPLFKDLLAQMQIDPRSTLPQLRITIAKPAQEAKIEPSVIVPAPIDLQQKEPEEPPSLSRSIFDRIAHILTPKRPSIQIDQAKKDLLTEQTKRVASLVADAIAEQLEDKKDTENRSHIGETPVLSELQSLFPETIDNLDSSYHRILNELIKRETWQRDEFETLVRSHRLMPEGTIDILNEWADEYLNDFILNADSEPYRINLSLLSP